MEKNLVNLEVIFLNFQGNVCLLSVLIISGDLIKFLSEQTDDSFSVRNDIFAFFS